MDAEKRTNGKAGKVIKPDGKGPRADSELKHDADLLLENLYREIDTINRRLDRLERKFGNRD